MSKNKAWMGWLLALLVVLTGGGWILLRAKPARCQRLGDHVGALRCRGCHEAEYKVWAKSAHRRAFQTLPEKERSNPMCLRCHTTGKQTHLQGVQCESCHGPGRYYVQPEVMVDPVLSRAVGLKVQRGIKGCLHCHRQSPKLRKFDYKKMWKQIAHGKKGKR